MKAIVRNPRPLEVRVPASVPPSSAGSLGQNRSPPFYSVPVAAADWVWTPDTVSGPSLERDHDISGARRPIGLRMLPFHKQELLIHRRPAI